VLKDAGLDVNELPADVRHAQLCASEAYGASIPIEKAVDKRSGMLVDCEWMDKLCPTITATIFVCVFLSCCSSECHIGEQIVCQTKNHLPVVMPGITSASGSMKV